MRKLTRNEWIAAAIALAFVGYMFFGNVATGIISSINNGENMTINNEQAGAAAGAENKSGVQAQDVVVGTGAEIKQGMQVGVNYVLSLPDGTVIQNSKEVGGGEPFVFTAGAGQLIPGWEMGILGMKVGGKRLLMIPPELGYGSQAVGPIPANSTLIFEIEVVSAQ